jgi:transcriptional regulator with XRE-family HTH domain
MAKNFRELQAKMNPESLERSRIRARELMAEMLLSEIRKAVGLTQEDLAAALGIKQPSVCQLESQDDMQVSTLQRLVRALGGQLEMIVHLPGGDIRISQFKEAS